MKIKNFTPHAINIISQKETRTFNSEGNIRVQTKSTKTGEIAGIPVFVTEFQAVEGLPESNSDTIIVSRIVLVACPHRTDLVCPNDLIRDSAGRVIGCKSFSRN